MKVRIMLIRFEMDGLWAPKRYSATAYIEKIVDPLLSRLFIEPDDQSLIASTTVALWHSMDYLAIQHGSPLREVREKVTSIEPRTKYHHAAAIARKHGNIQSSPAEFRLLDAVLRSWIAFELPDLYGSRKAGNADYLRSPTAYQFSDVTFVTPLESLTSCRRAIGTLL